MAEIVGRLRTPRLASAPASPVNGEMYYNTGDNTLYWWNGTSWISSSGGGGGAPSGPAGGDLAGTYPNPTIPRTIGDLGWNNPNNQNVDFNNYRAINIAAPLNPNDSATRSYVDGIVPEVYIGTAAPSPRNARTVWIDTDEPDPTVEAWHVVGAAGEPVFSGNWSAYAGYASPAFFKDLSGVVHLRGMIKKSVAITVGETMFTLPVGYRPADATHLFSTMSNSVIARVDINVNGNVIASTGTNAAWITLEGIALRGEQ